MKLVLAVSLDGRLSFTPASKVNLGGEGDRKVLEEALAWADASLMGAETLRIHKNTCLIHNPDLLKNRKLSGRNVQPICIIVSNKINFNDNLPFFGQPINRWLISTKSNSYNFSKLQGFNRKILIEDNWSNILNQLSKEGISKITLLGGASLIKSFLYEDQIDELQLTLTPKILGGKNTWTPFTQCNLPINMHNSNSWVLKKVNNLGQNEIMLNYLRNRTYNNAR